MPATHRQFDMVFEGGGAKGTVFVGALQELSDRGLQHRRLVGTSAGAITAALLAAGYTADEIKQVAEEQTPEGLPRFSTFMDPASPEVFSAEDISQSLIQKALERAELPVLLAAARGLIIQVLVRQLLKVKAFGVVFSLTERGGLYAGERFRQWMMEKLDAKSMGLGNSTLGVFHQKTGVDLSLVACDTFHRERIVLNHRTAPDCPVAWAVRMSMSIPLVWQEVIWHKEWGAYLGQDLTGHAIVDGGVLSNFALDLLVGNDDSSRAIMGRNGRNSAGLLGLLIDEGLEVPGAAATDALAQAAAVNHLADAAKDKTIGRLGRLINTVLEGRDKQFIRSYEKHVCRLPAKGYGTTEFAMSPERMTALVGAGRAAMKAHLDRG